jgi:hypothetical protein
MNKRVIALAFGSATLAAACTDAPQGTPLEVRREAGTVDGSNFECTGNWPSAYTPCNYPWSTRAATFASGSDGFVTLRLGRNLVPNDHEGDPVDGGGSSVFLYLNFNTPDDAVRASGVEITFSVRGDRSVDGISNPISGWISPLVQSRTAAGRNAGKFSLTFAWGAIHGTYDTASPAP